MHSLLLRVVNNPWFIGILTGLIVTWVSRIFLGKRDDREYYQKVVGANREVIYAIRPGISEGQIPRTGIIIALIRATARRARVDEKDLLTPEQISEELIKEVMDSSFISASKKTEFCTQLSNLTAGNETPKSKALTDVERIIKLQAAERRAESITYLSVLAGVLTAAMTGVMAFVVRGHELPLHGDSHRNSLQTLVPAFTAILSLLVATLGLTFYRQIRRVSWDESKREPAGEGSEAAGSRQDSSPGAIRFQVGRRVTGQRSNRDRTG